MTIDPTLPHGDWPSGRRLWLAATVFLALASSAQATPLNDVAGIPHLNTRGQEGYRQFLAAEPHRAFAIAPGGGWGWSQGAASADTALDQALEACQAHTRQRCVPYALDREVVFDQKGWGRLWRPYATAAKARRAPTGTAQGQRFPDLMLTAPTGKPMPLSSLKGKVVVLHFWGTWCPSCRHELPQFEKLQRAFSGRRDLVFVFTQAREPAGVASKWLKQQGLRLALHDSGAQGSKDGTFRLSDGGTIKDRHVAPVFPATYVLDRHGIVVFALRGSAEDWSQHEIFLRDLLANTR